MSTSLSRSTAVVAGTTLALLMVPAAGMLLNGGFNWGPGDFVAAAALIFGAGMAYVLATRQRMSRMRKVGIALLVVGGLAIVWAELAVGLFH